MNYADIKQYDVANGPGIRISLFVSGCNHHCNLCHSRQTWDYTYGIEATDEIINMIRTEILKRPFVKTIVLSGGDPFCSATKVLEFLDKLNLSGYTIWAYTGYYIKDLLESTDDKCKLLDRCEYLVDGPFEVGKRDITLRFRGSSNQHIYHKEYDKWLMEE